MKTIKSFFATSCLLFVTSFMVAAISKPAGGEGFEIYLNNKLLVQQFGSQINNVKTIQLDQAGANDELTIKYYHCGQAGKNRSITIRDAQNKTLKEWHFADVTGGKAEMTCKVKDIMGLKKANGTVTLNLYYACNELPKGRQLASLVVGAQNTAKL